MKILVLVLFISSVSFANNSVIDSKDISITSERDEVINQGLTDGEEVKSSVLNKKINSLKLKQEQFHPEFFMDFGPHGEVMPTATAYSIDTPTLITIEKKYDDADSMLKVNLNYFMRVYGPGTSGAACTMEVLFNGVPCGAEGMYQTFYKDVADDSIEIHQMNNQCLGLSKGTYNISLRKTRGNRGGGYFAGRCDFFHTGWGDQSLRVMEVAK